MKKISVVTPCYNEEENVEDVYNQVKAVFAKLDKYTYEHVFIDNCSRDKTVPILKNLAATDPNVKIIVNSRNFGPIRSHYHAMLQSKGDAVVLILADLQDPPVMIVDFIKKWEEGYKIVAAVKSGSDESPVFYAVRKAYYKLVNSVAEIELINNFYGFGLYDQTVIQCLRDMNDPYPYLRGLIAEIGFDKAIIKYHQHKRTRGFSKNNLYTLYDVAMLGFTSHSKVPLRMAIFVGVTVGFFSLLSALVYFVYKLLYWDIFNVGTAPLVIGLFFFSAVQLFFIGVLGEYIGAIQTKVIKRPLVIEKERVNF